MVTESLTIPVGVSGDIDDARLVKSNQQGECVGYPGRGDVHGLVLDMW